MTATTARLRYRWTDLTGQTHVTVTHHATVEEARVMAERSFSATADWEIERRIPETYNWEAVPR